MAESHADTTVRRSLLLSGVHLPDFLGSNDRLLTDLEKLHPQVTFHLRGHMLTLTGDSQSVEHAETVVLELLDAARANAGASEKDLRHINLKAAADSDGTALAAPILTVRGRGVRPQTPGQRDYVATVAETPVVFCVGPAGSGKTFLAIALAVKALQQREVTKIVLTRPAVEAGERLGYLPGGLEEKIDPYLRPLFDALTAMLDADTVAKLIESGTIEVAPLAYMRGRTLNEAFVILDEAQNTNPELMQIFLTRLGYASRMVVTGDTSQTDLSGRVSGLTDALEVLADVPEIGFVELDTADIVRNELVGQIVDAYANRGKI